MIHSDLDLPNNKILGITSTILKKLWLHLVSFCDHIGSISDYVFVKSLRHDLIRVHCFRDHKVEED